MKPAEAVLAGSIGIATALSGVAEAQTQQHPVKNIILVHGAFADGSSWSKVIPILEARGFHVVAVQNSLTSLKDDVNATRRILALQDGEMPGSPLKLAAPVPPTLRCLSSFDKLRFGR